MALRPAIEASTPRPEPENSNGRRRGEDGVRSVVGRSWVSIAYRVAGKGACFQRFPS